MQDLIRRSDALNCSNIVYIEYLETDDDGYLEGNADYIPVVKKKDIESIPAVDAVEVRHARWLVTDAYPHNVYCSECHRTYVQDHWQIWQDKPGDGGIERNYCPHCGARMDGEEEHNAAD